MEYAHETTGNVKSARALDGGVTVLYFNTDAFFQIEMAYTLHLDIEIRLIGNLDGWTLIDDCISEGQTITFRLVIYVAVAITSHSLNASKILAVLTCHFYSADIETILYHFFCPG